VVTSRRYRAPVATLWWRCVWGHVFPAPPVPDGGELQCPLHDDHGVCGTFFLFMPYGTQAEAERGEVLQGPGKWAPWARGERST
jgi:hypothetical protein